MRHLRGRGRWPVVSGCAEKGLVGEGAGKKYEPEDRKDTTGHVELEFCLKYRRNPLKG